MVGDIAGAVEKLCMDANYCLPSDVMGALREGYQKEDSPVGKDALSQILKNTEIAAQERIGLCQDSGVAVFFIDLGQQVRITGGNLEDAINRGVSRGYGEGYLRNSVVDDPLFKRTNTRNNTPSLIHIRIVPGRRVRIIFVPKGAGAENMSRLAMLRPADGVDGVKDFVVETVKRAGSNPCPPLIVGVGIGGNFEKAPCLAKRALLRRVGEHNPAGRYARLEDELLSRINCLGIGPQGLGGRVTALTVNIEWFPCHIASLPVAVNMQCHSARHKEIAV